MDVQITLRSSLNFHEPLENYIGLTSHIGDGRCGTTVGKAAVRIKAGRLEDGKAGRREDGRTVGRRPSGEAGRREGECIS